MPRTCAQVATDMTAVAEQAAAGLSSASVLEGRAIIRTPLLFPSGGTVVPAITAEADDCYSL